MHEWIRNNLSCSVILIPLYIGRRIALIWGKVKVKVKEDYELGAKSQEKRTKNQNHRIMSQESGAGIVKEGMNGCKI